MADINSLSAFKSFTDALPVQNHLMPVLFVGHGSPMNGIEDNEFSARWTALASEIPVPKAVLVCKLPLFLDHFGLEFLGVFSNSRETD